jgi:OmpA-OmpF porin, OOP family
MRHGVRLVALFLLGGAAAGCVGLNPNPSDDLDLIRTDIDAARTMAPQGPAFTTGLKDGYLGLTDYESATADPADAMHFARKAVASARATNVQPDALAYRSLTADAAAELDAARARLMAALDAGGRLKAAGEASRAQVAFDCWLEASEAGDQPRVDQCKATFEDAIGKVEAALMPGPADVYLVFFAWDRADISPVAAEVLDDMAEAFAEGRPGRVVIAGHADRSGTEAYNLALSERRARVVAGALVSRGVPVEAIATEWFGESQPRVETADGVREPQNRRVEIVFE